MDEEKRQAWEQSGGVYELMDGAGGDAAEVLLDVEDQRKIAAGKEYPLEARLEAFEDIIDSEVGDTPLMRVRNIEREFGLRQIWLKFEGANPSGTQKDRISCAQAMDALRRGFDAVTVATCGNYGVAIGMAASLAGLRCVIYIPETYRTKRIEEMEKMGAVIRRVPGDYETAVEVSREHAEREEIYDANPGGDNTAMQLRAYGGIAYELYDEMRDAPAVVSVPVSNGTTIAGIYRGFLSLYRRGKTSRMPRIVAGSSFNMNPIVKAWLKNSPECKDMMPERIHENPVNEPLVNWRSIDGDLALEAVRKTGGWAGNASNKSMLAFAKMLKEHEGLNVLPASTAGLIAMVEGHRKNPLAGDRYATIITGRKS